MLEYDSTLHSLGLTDAVVAAAGAEADGGKQAKQRLGVRRAAYLLVLLVLAVPGLVVHAPFIAIGMLSNALPRREAIATVKMMTMAFLVPGMYFLLACAVMWWYGFVAGVLFTAFGLPTMIVVNVAFFDELQRAASSVSHFVSLKSRKDDLPRLCELRAELAPAIRAIVEKNKPTGLDRTPVSTAGVTTKRRASFIPGSL